MDNEELLKQIATMMEKQTELMQKEINGIKILIENDVTKRIDALFDGYKLTHEKQWELERRVSKIEEKLGIAI